MHCLEFLSVKKLEIEETKTTYIISVLKVVYWVFLVFSISNLFIDKGRNLSAKKIPTFGNSALEDDDINDSPHCILDIYRPYRI